jgi:hypothetical protein
MQKKLPLMIAVGMFALVSRTDLSAEPCWNLNWTTCCAKVSSPGHYSLCIGCEPGGICCPYQDSP